MDAIIDKSVSAQNEILKNTYLLLLLLPFSSFSLFLLLPFSSNQGTTVMAEIHGKVQYFHTQLWLFINDVLWQLSAMFTYLSALYAATLKMTQVSKITKFDSLCLILNKNTRQVIGYQ